MAPTKRAFLSYAHRYGPWVEVFQQNLEACLRYLGAEPHEVFLDTVDLGSGRSWVDQLQGGLAQAEHLILVMTPEALASPRVEDEWGGFIATRNDWARGHLHLVRLVDCPLPPFLAQMQWVDFTEHDEAKYCEGLRRLLAGLLGKTTREKPTLLAGLVLPQPPADVMPAKLRAQLVSWLAPRLQSKRDRAAIVGGLALKSTALDGQPSPDCAASALLVEATGADDRISAGLRVVDGLIELFKDDEPAETISLQQLKSDLDRLRQDSPEAGLLGVYLRQVATDHDRLVPYFQQKAELDLLDRVYVKLELRPELTKGAGREEKDALRAGQPLGIREVLALTSADSSWVTGRWVILGDPGAGKTTLVRHLAAGLARETGRPWVPVLDSLPRMMREREWLLDRIARRLRRAGHAAEGLPAVLDREAKEGRLLLLLDGLDEVPKDDREEAEALLRDLSARWPQTPLVVTSRPIGYHRPGSEFRELELLPLDEARRREFLARWFGRQAGEPDAEKASEVLAMLREDPNLWEVSGNPLYLTLMALLLEQGSSPQRNRGRLYDQVFELLLGGKHKPEPQPMECQEAVRGVLRYLGYGMTQDNRDAETERAIEARLYQKEADGLREPLERVPRWRQGLRPFLEDLSERTGILGPHDGPEADWRFWHRTFREALAAEELEGRWTKGGAEAILAHAKEIAGDESRWAESYALLTGRIEEPDELVKTLVQESPALGLRALATAQGLQESTITEVLELTTEDVDERGKVFLRLPELVGDGERAWRLIDRLRRATRNGNDLFFLDLAAREVIRLYPDHARAAEALLARFFDHIPPPPEELFRWVETPLDGRVELWRAIPAGSFWMGSPEGVGYDDEHPRHRVTFRHGFQMAAVPVTNAQYALFDPGKEPERWKGVAAKELPHHPRVNVTWYEAVAFCRWLAAAFEWAPGARLPTEEEWEHACRAGRETAYWSGDDEADLARVGWYDANSGRRTHRVGEKPANPWGLYDVHGNVWEWTASEGYSDYSRRGGGLEVDPEAVPSPGLAEPSDGEQRVVRGGSAWLNAYGARAAYRYDWLPRNWYEYQGFRVALPAVPER